MSRRGLGACPRALRALAAASLLIVLASCAGTRGLVVDYSDSRLEQGGLALLHIGGRVLERPLQGSFRGGGVAVVPHGRTGAWAIVGADLESEPGRYYITFRRGREEFSSSIRIVSGEFRTARIRLPREMVEFDEEARARIGREKKRLLAVLSRVTPRRLWKGPFIMPLRGRTTGEFGERRVLNGEQRSPHGGLDIAAPAGTPVRAAARGRVALRGSFFFYGNFVVLDHGLGVYTLYAHMEKVLVKEGDPVDKGQTIGLVGATGRATGPHLHFAVSLGGARVSPEAFIATTRRLERLMEEAGAREGPRRPAGARKSKRR